MRLWTKQLDEGVHAATSVVSSSIAFRHQKLATGMEKLEKFHQRMPDPVKRERSWENITKSIESRYFPESIKRFDKLLGDMETALAESSWLARKEFSLADIGYAPYITRLDHLQLQFLWPVFTLLRNLSCSRRIFPKSTRLFDRLAIDPPSN